MYDSIERGSKGILHLSYILHVYHKLTLKLHKRNKLVVFNLIKFTR